MVKERKKCGSLFDWDFNQKWLTFRLTNTTAALKELGYKDSTIKEHRKKTLRFLKLNNNSQITTEALKEYINNHCDKSYSKMYTISVKKSINVFYNFLCTNSIDLSRIKRDTYIFSEEVKKDDLKHIRMNYYILQDNMNYFPLSNKGLDLIYKEFEDEIKSYYKSMMED